jgi:hypothetical protein
LPGFQDQDSGIGIIRSLQCRSKTDAVTDEAAIGIVDIEIRIATDPGGAKLKVDEDALEVEFYSSLQRCFVCIVDTRFES